MPIVKEGNDLPAWCELRDYNRVSVQTRGPAAIQMGAQKNRILATLGQVQCVGSGFSHVINVGQFYDCPPGIGEVTIHAISPDAQIIHLAGHWGEELGGCGVFRVNNDPEVTDVGDPVSYPKTTGFDRHYHDCDEYWIILDGEGEVVVGGVHYDVGPGDCVATGMGFHHDFPTIEQPIVAVYFETTLAGRKRPGHLWEHTHGAPDTRPGRF